MRHNARLRKALAWKRGRSAAAVAAALLFVVGPAAAAAPPAWTKAWSEQQLREHFAAVRAVCLPLGPATRQNGANAFKEFVCELVLRDGSHYTIHLKPRTRTTWTTVGGVKSHGGGGGSARGGDTTNSGTHGHNH